MSESETKKKAPNRTRSVSLQIMVTPEDRDKIDAKIKKSGLTRTRYLTNLLLSDDGEKHETTGRTEVGDVLAELRQILSELKQEGNNFNQALRNVYVNPSTERDALLEAVAGCDRLYDTVVKKIKEVSLQ
ncbi:MAG: hypothetical protein LUD72_11595 [Bacteroidales bacterium]|nr:hypothetical protein [Bacteroidales bacterium]